MTKSLIDLAAKWLKDNGYDGLYNSDSECACLCEGLMTCEDPSTECMAGYKWTPEQAIEQGESFDPNWEEWFLTGNKPKDEAK